jgi:hypothetical protein
MGLFDIFSSDAAGDAAENRVRGYTQGYAQAGSALSQGLGNALDTYGRAAAPFAGLTETGNGILGSTSDAYKDALGLNGSAGAARARQRFQTSPGYDFALNQGLDQIDRRAASRGMLGSGNTNADATNYATGLANQEWNNTLNRYLPFAQLGGSLASTGATGQAGAYGGAANAWQNYGNNLAHYGWQENTGIGDARAAADLARYGASANQLGLGMNLAKTLFGSGGYGGFSPFSLFAGGG